MIDLHSHLLPGVDDGPESIDEAVEMCRIAYETGCRTIVATPHRRRDQWPDLPHAELRRRLQALRAAAAIPIEIELGAEVRVDSELIAELDATPDDELPTLGASNALLLELEPRGIGPHPVDLADLLVERGFRPVVAHPELTPCLRGDLGLAEELVRAGALLQVTAMSVTGEFGRAARVAADELLDAGLVAVVASDAHRPDWRPPGLSRARAQLARQWGEEVAEALTERNPRELLATTRPRAFGQEASA